MASRRETAARRRALVGELESLVAGRRLRPGDALPSTRTLAERHQISVPVVSEELRRLVAKGAIRSVPGVGTFVAEVNPSSDRYLYVYPREEHNPGVVAQLEELRYGFEKRASELGVGTLAVAAEDLAAVAEAVVGSIAGIFAWPRLSRETEAIIQAAGLPTVRGAYPDEPAWLQDSDASPGGHRGDVVKFDDVGGGEAATLHLIRHGHERIGFLAAHHCDSDLTYRRWSKDREHGWKSTMESNGLRDHLVATHPARRYEDSRRMAREAAARFMPVVAQVTAVVGADDMVLHALVKELSVRHVDPAEWPAMVGFEATSEMAAHVLTSLRTPWREAGMSAADTLWHRIGSGPDDANRCTELPFDLIARSTSLANWSTDIGIRRLAAAT